MTGYGRNRIEEERNIVMLKKLLLPVVLALALAGYPAPSHALCVKIGTIIGVTVDDADFGQTHTIRLRTSALADRFWFTVTDDNDLVNGAISFMVGQKQVRLQGNKESCPTSASSDSAFFMGSHVGGIITQ